MSQLTDQCIAILKGALGLPDDAARKHPFIQFVAELEHRSHVARLAYPIVYLVIGLVFVATISRVDPTHTDSWSKVFGAVVGVFSALLAFWKPDIELKQSDFVRLTNKQLTTADLNDINKTLALPSKAFDNIVKLVGALASFLAVYLLLGK